MSATTALATTVASGINKSDLPTADFEAPWMDFFTTIGGFIIATIVVVLVVVMIIGVGIWIAGKLGAGGRAQESGIGAFVWGLVASVLIGTATTLVVYFSDVGPDWMTFDEEISQQEQQST